MVLWTDTCSTRYRPRVIDHVVVFINLFQASPTQMGAHGLLSKRTLSTRCAIRFGSTIKVSAGASCRTQLVPADKVRSLASIEVPNSVASFVDNKEQITQ